jgi:hypothetical protein
LTAATLLSTQHAYAFQCPPVAYSVVPEELAGWAARFEVIFVGIAENVKDEEATVGARTKMYRVATFSVVEVLAGLSDRRNTTVRSQIGTWGGVGFRAGVKYLVFANYDSEQQLNVYSCGVHQFPNEESDSQVDDTHSMANISKYLKVLRNVL